MSNNVRIAHDNLLETATDITASGEVQFFEAINLADWRTNTAWKGLPNFSHDVVVTLPAELQPTAFAIFHHNFNDWSNVSLSVEYWTGSGWGGAVSLLSGPFAGVIMREFDLVTAPALQWRLSMSSLDGGFEPIIAHWFLGDFITLKSQKPNFGPAIYNDTSKFRTELSESGQFLGRTFESTDHETTLRLDLLRDTEVESKIKPWLDHAKYLPFYYSWDQPGHPDEAAYCWTIQNPRVSYYRTPAFMRVDARMSARIE